MAAVFLLPLWMSGSLIALGGFAVLRLATRSERSDWWSGVKQPGWHWILPAFFLLHVLGLLWSSNLGFGLKDLETKLGLLLIPLLLCATDQRTHWPSIRTASIGGCIVACLYLLGGGLWTYITQGTGLSLFYIELSSPLMHPTYMSMLINMALLLLIERISDSNKERTSKSSLWAIMLFFWFMLDLLSARMPFMVTLITCSGFLLMLKFRKAINSSDTFRAALCMVVGLGGMVMASSYTGRANEVSQAITASASDTVTYNSTTGRIEIWRQGLALLPGALPFGTGTGDVKDALLESYRSHGFSYGLDRRLNAHNQYLQTTLALGLPGILCLMLIVTFPILQRKAKMNSVLGWFVLMIGLNATVESIFEVQRGVLLIALFIPLLMSIGPPLVGKDRKL